ncbi:hypothetical protein D3C83_128410 [compost metagenome]
MAIPGPELEIAAIRDDTIRGITVMRIALTHMVPMGSIQRAMLSPACDPERRMMTPINSPAPSAVKA